MESMNFELPEELRLLKETVRRFVDKELIPIERTACDGPKLKPDMRQHLETKARELGLVQYDVPQEYGGLGMGLLAQGGGVVGDGAQRRAAVARGRDLRPHREPDPLSPRIPSRKSAFSCRPFAAR